MPVISGKEREWKDGKWQDTDRDLVINSTEPQWTKKPSELTDEDYLAFYRELYPGDDDPLFWIHLNVDYPFKHAVDNENADVVPFLLEFGAVGAEKLVEARSHLLSTPTWSTISSASPTAA